MVHHVVMSHGGATAKLTGEGVVCVVVVSLGAWAGLAMEVASNVVDSVGEKASAQCCEVVGVKNVDGGIGRRVYPHTGSFIPLTNEP